MSSGGGGMGGGGGTEPTAEGNAAGCPESPASPSCEAWAACDPCASACGCDATCVTKCERRIFAETTNDILLTPNDPVRMCSAPFVDCFADALGGTTGGAPSEGGAGGDGGVGGNAGAAGDAGAGGASDGRRAANCVLLAPCCDHLQGSTHGTYCSAIVTDNDDAACLLMHYRYVRDGDCQ